MRASRKRLKVRRDSVWGVTGDSAPSLHSTRRLEVLATPCLCNGAFRERLDNLSFICTFFRPKFIPPPVSLFAFFALVFLSSNETRCVSTDPCSTHQNDSMAVTLLAATTKSTMEGCTPDSDHEY